MTKIIIGKVGSKEIGLDLNTLLTTRLLVTADSGGGKTVLLKRICEQAFGKIQIIVVDPEGEFSPLRQKFNFVLVGKGGDTPADPRSAALVAQRLLELRASAICDIYEMKPSVRHTWVKLFLDGLLEAPKNLRHPCMVIVDEAHLFDPEHGKGESEASDAMKGLCTRGRKRLLCAVFATQRLATLSKDSSSMLLNRLIGPTFEDVNRKRAADTLSIANEDKAEFYKQIQMLEPGQFFALGRAISKERVLVQVGSIETPHGQEAIKYELAPPPAPEQIKALLPKLADLPREAEEKAKTEAELRKEIRELKEQVRNAPAATDGKKQEVDRRSLDRSVLNVHNQYRRVLAGLRRDMSATLKEAAGQTERLDRMIASVDLKIEEKIPGGEVTAAMARAPVPRVAPIVRTEERPLREVHVESNGHLPKGESALLRAVAMYPEGADRSQLTVLTGYKRSSRDAYISRLIPRGYVRMQGSLIVATDEGIASLGDSFEPLPTGQELVDYWMARLPEGERKLFEILVRENGEAIERSKLDEESGYQRSSRDAYLSRLAAKKLVEFAGRGEVKAAGMLFE